VLLALLAHWGIAGPGAFNVTLGLLASGAALVSFATFREERTAPRLSSLARTLSPLMALATVYFAAGCWVFYSGARAPENGYISVEPLGTVTVIASREDPKRLQAVLEHFVGEGDDTALIGVSAVDDPRMQKVQLQLVDARGGTHEPVAMDSPLRDALRVDGAAPGAVQLRATARVNEPVSDDHPVTLVVFSEHGRRDIVWQLVHWFHRRYGAPA
jgi:hypothetical protein